MTMPNGEGNIGFNPRQNWIPTDYAAVEEGITGEVTRDRVLELFHKWRMGAIQLVIPPTCHEEYKLWLKKNFARKGKEVKPMPFDQWGVDVTLLEEPCYSNSCGTIIKGPRDDEASSGFERRHELIYGRKVLSYFEYAFLPMSEETPVSGGDDRPVWEYPHWVPPAMHIALGGLLESPDRVRRLGEAWISLAQFPREPLLEAVAEYDGHRYPLGAMKMKFLGLDKAGEKVVEVIPEPGNFAVPVWTLGDLPQP